MKLRLAATRYFLAASIGYVGVIGLLLFSPQQGQSQSPDTSSFKDQYQKLLTAGKNEDTLTVERMVNRLLKINLEHSGDYDSLIISTLIWHYQWKKDKLSVSQNLQVLHACQSILEKLAHPFPADLARFYSLYIQLFWTHYQMDSVAYYLDEMEHQLEAVTWPVAVKIGWFYEKGRLATSQGDYEASLTFSQQGLEYLEHYFPDELRFKYLLKNVIGITYRRTGRTDDAINWYEDILSNNDTEIHSVRMKGAVLNNLGLAYKDCGEWESAVRRLSDAITYYTQNFSPTFPDIGSGYDNIAICYQAEGNLERALYYSFKSMDFISKNLGPTHPDLLLPMNSITSSYFQQGNLDAALAMNLRAQSLMQTLGWSPANPEGDYYLADGFDVFAYAVDIQRAVYDATADTSHLESAIRSGSYFMAMTDYAYDNLKNDLSKEIFQKKHANVFSACIWDLYTLYQLTRDTALIAQAFAYSEKFKSLELLYAAQKDKADQVERYKFLNHEYNTQMDSIRHYEEIYYATGNDPGLHHQVSSQLNGFKESLYLWKERVRQEHPDYYQLIYHPEPVTMAALQQALAGTDQCILSYHLSDDVVYMFVITSGQIHFVRKELDTSMPNLISSFRTSIYGYFADTSRSESNYVSFGEQFVETGTRLYSYLIAPVENWLSQRVVIIVDKSLGYIPFDLLLKEKPDIAYHYRDHHYLLQDHALSYNYSARFWMDMRRRPSAPKMEMLAMAPDFPEADPGHSAVSGLRSGFTKLYYNEAEVREINHVIPGKIWIGREATKDNFIRYCGQYPIIHLATHSTANDDQGDYSFLVFSHRGNGDDHLLANEIYNLDLRAELVTLSACETGLGELKYGEGIISLARAFSFAGAKSIVSSLWSVNDKSTPAVMSGFYRNIKAGMPKDVALQKAKLDFIAARGHADAHPFYWGGFICVGDMQPFMTSAASSIPNLLLITVGILVVITILFFFIKKNKNLGTSGS